MKWAGLKVNESHSVVSDSWAILGILQARILEWVAFPFSMGSFQSRGRTQILYQLSHKGSPRILEWVSYPFSRGSFRSRNRTRVSCIAGRFFTSWATREAPAGLKTSLNLDNADILGTLLWEPSRLKWKHERLHWLCSWIQHCTDHSGDITHLMKKREMS